MSVVHAMSVMMLQCHVSESCHVNDDVTVSCQYHPHLLVPGEAEPARVLQDGDAGHDPVCADLHRDGSAGVPHVRQQHHQRHLAVL